MRRGFAISLRRSASPRRRIGIDTASALLALACAVAGCRGLSPAAPDNEPAARQEAAPVRVSGDGSAEPARSSTRVDGLIRPLEPAPAGPLVRQIGRGTTVGAGPRSAESGGAGDVSLNFIDTDIREITRVILGDTLKLDYIIDPGIQGTATIQTPRPLRREELLPTLQGILAENGAAMVYSDGVFRIMAAANPAALAPLVDPNAVASGSQVVPLRYASAQQLAAMLAPYVGEGGKVVADPTRNVLVIAGSPSARASLIDLIRIFDVDYLAGQSYALFPVQSGEPEKVAKDLTSALQLEGEGALANTLRIVPVDHANAIMVIAQQPAYLDRASRLIAQLDAVAQSAGRNLHVIFLKNILANDVQPALQKAFNPPRGGGGAEENAPGELPPTAEAAQATTPPPAAAGAGSPPPALGMAMGATPAVPTASSASPAATPQAASSPSSNASPPAVAAAPGAAQIIADRSCNCLLVVSTEIEFGKIEAAVRKLDVLPTQVLIEATIAEVTLNKALQYGTQFFFNNHAESATLSGVQSISPLTIGPGAAVTNAALFPGTLAPNFPGFAIARTVGSAQFALQALQSVTDVRVISSPTVLVLDNEEAQLQVGQMVPILTQSATSVATAGAPIVNSVSYQESGIILLVRPRVKSDALVTLNIDQEVSTPIATSSSTINSPTFDERKIKSRVVVQDGETIGLAGLISDTRTTGDSGIPVLKDIPVLGALFSTKSDQGQRQELIVLITPHIIHDQREARGLTEELRRKLAPSRMVP
jgi:general secretion pathway protein D